MTVAGRREALRRQMVDDGIDLLMAFHDGLHFIEQPNHVTALTGFKSLGETVLFLDRHGEGHLLVAPSWDVERAGACGADVRVTGTDVMLRTLRERLEHMRVAPSQVGVAGLSAMPWHYEECVKAALGAGARAVDAMVAHHARRKTADEVAHARTATRIAEQGYERLRAIARPGMREDELAADLKWSMKSLGAEDNFLMLCAGPHCRAVQPSSGRRLARGDLILAELTPSYRGQMAQICRTVTIGDASETLTRKYALVVSAMQRGIEAVRPGATMANVCRAIDAVLEAEGYGEYCHPPHIRRRGHGLGFASIAPGDVSLDNATVLEPDMFFVVHPNQYLPETGYLLCGEPVLVTAHGAEPLTERRAALATIAL